MALPCMYQAIVTKYLPATNCKPSRIKAINASGSQSVTVSYDSFCSGDEAHIAAAWQLATRLKWRGQWVGGATAEGFAFVQIDGTVTNAAFNVLDE